jgi:hypothetical protein
MKHSTKTKLGIILGVGLIVFVLSLLALPFSESDNAVQKTAQKSITKMESAETKMMNLIHHEKSELEWKIGGKIQP